MVRDAVFAACCCVAWPPEIGSRATESQNSQNINYLTFVLTVNLSLLPASIRLIGWVYLFLLCTRVSVKNEGESGEDNVT